MRNDYTINSEAYQRSIIWLNKFAVARSFDQFFEAITTLNLGLEQVIKDGVVIDEVAYKQCKSYQQYLASRRKNS